MVRVWGGWRCWVRLEFILFLYLSLSLSLLSACLCGRSAVGLAVAVAVAVTVAVAVWRLLRRQLLSPCSGVLRAVCGCRVCVGGECGRPALSVGRMVSPAPPRPAPRPPHLSDHDRSVPCMTPRAEPVQPAVLTFCLFSLSVPDSGFIWAVVALDLFHINDDRRRFLCNESYSRCAERVSAAGGRVACH